MKTSVYLRNIAIFLCMLIISIPIILAQELNLQYDAVGNLVTGDSFYREYDGFNHLIRIRSGNLSSGNITEEFIWHPIEESVFIKKIYWNNQSLRTTIKYLNKNTIKIKNESGTFYENYIYQDDILVAQRDTNGNKQAIHNDNLGSVSLITDSAGSVIENEFFSPYGEQITPVSNSRFSFTGKEFDNVNNEYDFLSRRSKPEWANRLTIPDRIFYDFTKYEEERIKSYYNPQGLNPYSYALNNPYRYVDITGNIFTEIAATYIALLALRRTVIYLTSYIIPYLQPALAATARYAVRKAGEALLNFATTETPEFKIQEGTYVPPEARPKFDIELCKIDNSCKNEESTDGKKIKKDKLPDPNGLVNEIKKEEEKKKEAVGGGPGGSGHTSGGGGGGGCTPSCTIRCIPLHGGGYACYQVCTVC